MLSEEVGLQASFEEANTSGEVHSTTSALNVLRDSLQACTVALRECATELDKGLHDGGGGRGFSDIIFQRPNFR